jgi:hypothetical protein
VTPRLTTSTRLEKIDHIVVLMMENRSFDHMLGYLSLDGATPLIISDLPMNFAVAARVPTGPGARRAEPNQPRHHYLRSASAPGT